MIATPARSFILKPVVKIGFLDPHGPYKARLAPYIVPLVLAALGSGPMVPVVGETAASVLFLFAVLAFSALGLNAFRQSRIRRADLMLGAGFIEIAQAGLRSQRIRTKDVIGASSARLGDRLVLSLQHARRDQPITIECASDAEVDEIRRALGVGHGGFGTVFWRTRLDGAQRAAVGGRVVTLVTGVLMMVGLLIGGVNIGVALFGLFGWMAVVGAILGIVGLIAPAAEPTVYMDRGGIKILTNRGWFTLPYEQVLGMDDLPSVLTFTVPQPYNRVQIEKASALLGGPSAAERDVLIAQIMSAAGRARGYGPEKTDVSGRLDLLRRNGDPIASWFTRLDMAGQMLGAGSGQGYRGTTLEAADLWAILEDPEAEPELRTAAARVLRHVPDPKARVRIDAAVATERDHAMGERFRIAMSENVAEASGELAYLEASEQALRQRFIPGQRY